MTNLNLTNLNLDPESDTNEKLGSVYTKRQRQHQCCDNSVMTLAIMFSLKTMELLEDWLQTPFWSDPIVSN